MDRRARSRWIRGVGCVLAGATGLLLGTGAPAAEDAPTYLFPIHRLVDVSAFAERNGAPARASIGDDSRYVLRPFRRSVPFDGHVDIEDGTFSKDLNFKWKQAKAITQVLFSTRQASGFEIRPPSVITSDDPTVRVDGLPKGKVHIQIRARRMLPAVRRDATKPIAVPDDAVLTFSMGILDIARDQPPVRFTVRFCPADRDCKEIFREDFKSDGKWADRTVPLSDFAGKSGRFRFRVAVQGEAGSWSFPVWGNPTIWERRPRPKDSPNLVLLSVDTLRADHLPTYGYHRDTAPFIDEHFGKGGTVFERAYSAATTTGPSHMTLLTGLDQASHGVLGDDFRSRLPDRAKTLAQILREAGFETGAFTENGPMSADRGFGRGFDQFTENKGNARFGEMQGFVEKTLSDGAKFLRDNKDKRVFLFLHTFQVHTPYLPPEKYQKLFPEPLPREHRIRPAHRPTLYDQEIRYTDDVLRQFVRDLDAPGVWDNTLFILVSDHGEAFGEHGLLFHGGVPYDEVLSVPLLLRGPGVPPAKRIAETVGLIDVTPTALELLRVEEPDGMLGRSLVPLLRGDDEPEEWKSRPVFSEASNGTATNLRSTIRGITVPTAIVVHDGDRKFIRRSNQKHELFDLAEDPGEKKNLWSPSHEATSELIELTDGYKKKGAEVRATLEAETGPTAPAQVLDPAQQQKLRALGYID